MTSGVPQAISAIRLMQQRLTQQKIDVTFEQDPLANDYPSKANEGQARENTPTQDQREHDGLAMEWNMEVEQTGVSHCERRN
jgi:hypothetical protein